MWGEGHETSWTGGSEQVPDLTPGGCATIVLPPPPRGGRGGGRRGAVREGAVKQHLLQSSRPSMTSPQQAMVLSAAIRAVWGLPGGMNLYTHQKISHLHNGKEVRIYGETSRHSIVPCRKVVLTLKSLHTALVVPLGLVYMHFKFSFVRRLFGGFLVNSRVVCPRALTLGM